MSKPISAAASICLVTSTHIASNPRIVKEANSLASAGYRVSLLGTQQIPRLSAIDEAIAKDSDWRFLPVDFGRSTAPYNFHTTRTRHFLARKASDLGLVAADERASNRAFGELLKETRKVSAQLYLAHNLGALPVAHRVAREQNAALGFDAEDFHSGELPDELSNQPWIRRARRLEAKYIPQCDYFSAASPLIAQEYAEMLGLETTFSLLNVCSLREAPDPRPIRVQEKPSIYWFSQTIGPGRGVEEVVEALARVSFEVHLYLQGTPDPLFVAGIQRRARRHGVEDQIHFLDPVLPEQLPTVAAGFDAGLAFEHPEVPNRDICLTNKIFAYLMAGIPTLANRTRAQKELGASLRDAMLLVEELDAAAVARALEVLFRDPEDLRRRSALSARLARERFNWEAESRRFLNRIAEVLGRKPVGTNQ